MSTTLLDKAEIEFDVERAEHLRARDYLRRGYRIEAVDGQPRFVKREIWTNRYTKTPFRVAIIE